MAWALRRLLFQRYKCNSFCHISAVGKQSFVDKKDLGNDFYTSKERQTSNFLDESYDSEIIHARETTKDDIDIEGSRYKMNFAKIKEVQSQLKKMMDDTSVQEKAAALLLNRFYRNNRRYLSDETIVNLHKSHSFMKLCIHLEAIVHAIRPPELKNIFDFCVLFKVSKENSLMKKILFSIPERINEFSPLDVLSIYCLIVQEKLQDVEGFNTLALVCYNYMLHSFEDKLSTYKKIPKGKVIYFAFNKILPSKIHSILLNYLNGIDFESVTDEEFQYILRKMIHQKPESLRNFNIGHVITALKKKLNSDMKPSTINYLLNTYASGITFYGYDEELCDKFADYCVEKEFDFETTIRIASKLSGLGHENYDLLQYLKKLIENDPTEIEEISEDSLLSLFNLLSNTGWFDFKDDIKKICQEKFQELEFPHITSLKSLLKNIMRLEYLGVHQEVITNKAIKMITLASEEKDPEDFSPQILWKILWLHQCLSLKYPHHETKFSEEVLEKVTQKLKETFNPNECQEEVYRIFGGPNYVLTNCVSEYKNIFSYVVALKPGNVPVDLSEYKGNSESEVINIRDIVLPSNARLIVIQEILQKIILYFKNTNRSKEYCKMYLKMIEELGFDVVPLYKEQMDLLNREKVHQYVLQSVEKKIGKLSNSADNPND